MGERRRGSRRLGRVRGLKWLGEWEGRRERMVRVGGKEGEDGESGREGGRGW